MSNPGLSDELAKEAVDAREKYGSKAEAARALGLPQGTFNNRYKHGVMRGYSPKHDMKNMSADGFAVTGTSTLYDEDNNPKMQWVKTARDKEAQKLAMEAAIEAMCEDIPRIQPLPAPVETYSNLCNLYTITDYHFGMLAWEKEGGANWDLKIASDTLERSFEQMVSGAPTAKHCVINQLGDFLHSDGILPVTPTSGHHLDQDGRFSKIVTECIKILRKLVDYALLKHDRVHVVMAEGNHDITSSIWLRAMFKTLYENEPRVTVNDSELPYYVYQHGKVFLGFHHGHKKNNSGLPGLFAAQFREMWGKTDKGYIHTGHRHHKEVKEYPGVIVEQHQTLAARDAHASRGGWLSERSATCITYHTNYGEVGRNTITPEMIE